VTTEAALEAVIADLARRIDEDFDVAAGLIVMAAGSVTATHGIPRHDIEAYAVDYDTPVTV
jgi:hypothetical protein